MHDSPNDLLIFSAIQVKYIDVDAYNYKAAACILFNAAIISKIFHVIYT